MISLVKKNSAFFIPYFIFLLVGGCLLVFNNNVTISTIINSHHDEFADLFFRYWTNIGLGWLIIPVILLLIFVRLRYGIIAIVCFILSFAVNDTIKYIAKTPRPIEVFSQLHQTLYYVPDVEIYHWNSLPSGHTATAFCMFSLLALIAPKNYLKFICFLVAFLVGYSRMYLSEHFLVDVYVGSIIGVLTTLVIYAAGMKMAWFSKFPIMDKPLIKLN